MSAVPETITSSEMPAPIVFTDSAAAKVADLIAEEGNPDLKLRVFVQGGGCSGFQYGFTFDEITNDDDLRLRFELLGLNPFGYQPQNRLRAVFCCLSRVDGPQHAQTACARHAGQVARQASQALLGQPGEGSCLHLQRIKPDGAG